MLPELAFSAPVRVFLSDVRVAIFSSISVTCPNKASRTLAGHDALVMKRQDRRILIEREAEGLGLQREFQPLDGVPSVKPVAALSLEGGGSRSIVS